MLQIRPSVNTLHIVFLCCAFIAMKTKMHELFRFIKREEIFFQQTHHKSVHQETMIKSMCGAFCTKAEKANIETLSPNVLENIVKNTMDRKMKE